MKTAEKILLISLDLFNQEGERNISSVDIANELEISPGNLYYHFKGKEEIVSALVDLYVARINKIKHSGDGILDFYTYLYFCLESMHLFRFLFQNMTDISAQYPHIDTKLKRSAQFQRTHIKDLLVSQSKNNTIKASPESIEQLVDTASLTLFQSLSYYQMQGIDLADTSIIYRSLMTIYFSVQAYYLDSSESEEVKNMILTKTLAEDSGQ